MFIVIELLSDLLCVCVMQVGLAGATRKANFAAPMRGAYTGLGAARTGVNRPAGAELGNWSTTYTNSYEVGLLTHVFLGLVRHAVAVR